MSVRGDEQDEEEDNYSIIDGWEPSYVDETGMELTLKMIITVMTIMAMTTLDIIFLLCFHQNFMIIII